MHHGLENQVESSVMISLATETLFVSNENLGKDDQSNHPSFSNEVPPLKSQPVGDNGEGSTTRKNDLEQSKKGPTFRVLPF